jgi:magnesium transporter
MNNTEIDFPKGSKSDLRDVITNQLLIFLEAQNYDTVKTLLIPVASNEIKNLTNYHWLTYD